VTVAGTVLAASQLAPVQLYSDFTSSNKTLTSFSASTTKLTTKQRSELKSLVSANSSAESAACTGLVAKGATKASCDYVNVLQPFMRTTVTTKVTTNRSLVGRVIVTLLTPVEEQIAAPAPVVRANPFATPFPEVFSRSEMVSTALDNLEKYIAANASSKSYELAIHPDHQSQAQSIGFVFGRAYDALPFPVGYQKTIAVVSSNREFTDKKIADFGFSRHDVNGCW